MEEESSCLSEVLIRILGNADLLLWVLDSGPGLDVALLPAERPTELRLFELWNIPLNLLYKTRKSTILWGFLQM